MRIDVVSVFPSYLEPLTLSLLGRAIADGVIDLRVHDLRAFTQDRHKTVDDTPYGGGPGMVMKPEPWGRAIDEILSSGNQGGPEVPVPTLIIPTPSGERFIQTRAQDLAQSEWIIFLCGRYEGIDTRVATHYRERIPVLELSIGDYVLAGGEAATLVMTEAIVRLVPGILGNAESVRDDSFSPERTGAPLEGAVYTKPAMWRGLEVPAVLRSGDHGAIAQWREGQAQARTADKRPDLR